MEYIGITYMAKPIIIKAKKYDGSNFDELALLGDDMVFEGNPREDLILQTLRGELCVKIGDWIINDPLHGWWACSEEVFHATYEPAYEINI